MRGSLPCCQEAQSPRPIISINFSSPKTPVVFLGVCSQQNHGLPTIPLLSWCSPEHPGYPIPPGTSSSQGPLAQPSHREDLGG